ncbi:MAG TPA: RNB domain-containing ribonuclease [Mycobacteriales bacterium]|nr:RNB domain-containing ribonuclease [Mycobacteriales bacterium]
MGSMRVRLTPVDGEPADSGIVALLGELEVPVEFSAELVAAAEAAAARAPGPEHVDDRSVPLVTIDPPTSRDLDQAFHAERRGDGYRLHYAIADVGWFVRPGDLLDQEARRRGVTIYAADRRAPLYPPALSEAAASLLPEGDRPALMWRIDLDASGEPTAYDVRRALVRSRAKLSYAEVQSMLDGGTASPPLQLLKEIGLLREDHERARGGVHLPTPEQEAVATPEGWCLELRTSLPVENWNAQISLLTGLCAAQLMLDAGVGLLRTLPPPDDHAVASLRRSAKALDVAWPTATP